VSSFSYYIIAHLVKVSTGDKKVRAVGIY